MQLAFQLVQTVYWLALSTWFGAVLFIALAAPVIFRTVQENNPILTNVLSVNLEGQHGTLLAGTIVANLIQRLLSVELICGGALLITLIIQPFVIDLSSDPHDPLSNNTAAAVIRSLLFVAAAGIVVYDWRVLWPRIAKFRSEYIDHADEPEVANPAKDQFDREQRRSLNLLMVLAGLLLGMILFSSNISPPAGESAQVLKQGK
jgi:hypothetical protein